MFALPRGKRAATAATVAAFGVLVLVALAPAGAQPTRIAHLSWHPISSTSSPAASDRVGMAFDPHDNYTVAYGGYNANGYPSFYYNTWTFAGGNWTQISPANHPSAPTGFVMAYDPALSGVLEFGGEAPYGSAYYNETWLFQGGNWTLLHPTVSPPARSQYAMAYDAEDQEMVLFGGIDSGYSAELADTWVFNGTTWAHVISHKTPMGRQAATMIYDAAIQKVLLLGGRNSTYGSIPATWAFAGGQWAKLPMTGTPLRSYLYAAPMANGTPMIFGGLATGGSATYNNSFEFFSGAWHLVKFLHAPSPRGIGALTYDGRDGYMLLFGGYSGVNGYTVYGDTYALR